ncbi:MAG: MarR family transcriptional regulator [Propionibacteriaceae bacterium]|jgi:DNA-binding MarR family transcriptional regulator|nr:MarR family transcriptional regulator [Propionibacteriaceae bacterium]
MSENDGLAQAAATGRHDASDEAAAGEREDALRDLATNILRVSRLGRSDVFEGLGMSRSQYSILVRLMDTGTRRLTALAGEIGLELSAASRQANALWDAGAISRDRDPEDGRAFLLTITDAGREAVEAVRRKQRAWLNKILDGYTSDDMAVAAAILARVVEGWRKSAAAAAVEGRQNVR